MANFLKDIMEALGTEEVEAVCIGTHYTQGQTRTEPKFRKKYNRLVPWEEAQKILDYKYDSGYGGEDCHPLYLWTASRVLFVACYDGATWIESVPRHPEDCEPAYMGGG